MIDEHGKKTSDNVSPASVTVGGSFNLDELPVSTRVVDKGVTDKKTSTSLLFGRCLCASSVDETSDNQYANEFFTSFCSTTTRSFQFVEIGGVECISLGSITSELTPMERVTETIRRLIANDEARLSIGYVSVLNDIEKGANVINMDDDIDDIPVKRDTETTPLDIYSKNIGVDLNQCLSSDLIYIVENLKSKRFDMTIQKSQEMLQRQRSVFERGKNNDEADDAACLMGITLHNIAVVNVFAGRFPKAIEIFQEAVEAKKAYFGDNHHLVADSLHEMGILHFANERFVEALAILEEAKNIRTASFGPDHPKVAMVMNNIACLKFLSKEPDPALTMLKEGKQILRSAMGQMKKMVKLDLLHMAIVSFNLGYVESRLKNYDEARSLFEEALMVQQSVLDDTHETIKDTKANIDFTNAFHS